MRTDWGEDCVQIAKLMSRNIEAATYSCTYLTQIVKVKNAIPQIHSTLSAFET